MGASDSIERREKNYFSLRLENSTIKIFSNEKFYGYDDGFGIRIKQRFSAIIRGNLWRSIINRKRDRERKSSRVKFFSTMSICTREVFRALTMNVLLKKDVANDEE